jgi:ketosteroid isomerase-like protein
VEQLEWERVKAAPDARSVRQFLTRFPQQQEALQWLKAQEASEKANVNTAVLEVIARYAKAYENKDVEAMQAARPGFAAADKKRLEQAFREFKSIRYSLTPTGDPAIEPTVATVKCRLKVEMRSNDGGSPRPVDQAVTVKLRRQADAWVIDTIQ